MRRFLLFTCLFGLLLSCGDEIEFNTPAVQGNKDGNLWRAEFYAADIDFGGFLVEGGIGLERVQLVTQIDSRGTFELGGDSPNRALFKDAQGVVYSTANAPDESLSLYPATGVIIVDNIEQTEPKTISGTFWFYAYTADGLNTVNFSQGVFYKIPLIGGLVEFEAD
jgi:hypothetical protein